MSERIPEFDEGEAKPIVTHSRDLVVYEGAWEQDYHFLDYDFAPAPFGARAYFDEPGVVIVHRDGGKVAAIGDLPDSVRSYLQYRFDRIQVIGPDAMRATIWDRADAA